MAFGNNKSDQDSISEINVTPLVDVMLVLLVVFIVTAPLLTQSVRVQLPKTVSAEPSPQNHLANISLDAEGKIFLDSQVIEAKDLGAHLSEKLARDAELIVQFNADSRVNYGRVAEVMAIARQAGITRLSFLTQEETQ